MTAPVNQGARSDDDDNFTAFTHSREPVTGAVEIRDELVTLTTPEVAHLQQRKEGWNCQYISNMTQSIPQTAM